MLSLGTPLCSAGCPVSTGQLPVNPCPHVCHHLPNAQNEPTKGTLRRQCARLKHFDKVPYGTIKVWDQCYRLVWSTVPCALPDPLLYSNEGCQPMCQPLSTPVNPVSTPRGRGREASPMGGYILWCVYCMPANFYEQRVSLRRPKFHRAAPRRDPRFRVFPLCCTFNRLTICTPTKIRGA